MKKSNLIKNKLFECINELCENKKNYCINPNSNFTRKSLLDFSTVMKTVLSFTDKSLNNEIVDIFLPKGFIVTASALIQQRSKIKTSAFYDLFTMFSQRTQPTSLFKGFRLIAVDGSDIQIPVNPEDKDSYFEGTDGQAPYNLLHLNALYDICSHTYVDALVQKRHKWNEHSALLSMLKRTHFDSNTIITADRGFESYNNLANIQELGLSFVFRVKDIHANGIASALDLPDEEFDIPFDLNITRKQSKETKELFKDKRHYKILPTGTKFDFLPAKSKHSSPATFYKLRFRVLRFKISENTYETIVTNLDFPVKVIKQIYAMRWGIETAFRTLKYTVGLLYFHSKKTELILQEIFANLTIYNFTQMIASISIRKKGKKYKYKINISVAVNVCRNLFLDRISPNECETAIRKYILPIRTDRKFIRHLHSKPAFSFTYRVA